MVCPGGRACENYFTKLIFYLPIVSIDSCRSFFALLYVGILKLFTGSGSTVFTLCHHVPKVFPLLPFLMLVFSPKLAVKLFNKVNYSIKYFRSLF